MSLKEKASKPAEALHQEVQQKAASRAAYGAGTLNPYIPYLIAASFVAMTALLTLLLTMVIDNKAELDEVIAERQQFPKPILADARMAFGQGMDTGMQSETSEDSSALLPGETAIDPETLPGMAMPDATASAQQTLARPASYPVKPMANAEPEPTKPVQQIATDSVRQAGGSPADRKTQTVALTGHPDVATNSSIVQAATEKQSGDNALGTIMRSASLQLVHSNHEYGNRQLDKIVSSHEAQIRSFNKMLQQQTVNREEMQHTITHHMQLMESQIQAIEEILRPEIPSAVVGYDRMIYRQRESFQRMMERRNKMMQRALESRHRLREDYTLLLNLLHNGEEIAQLAIK